MATADTSARVRVSDGEGHEFAFDLPRLHPTEREPDPVRDLLFLDGGRTLLAAYGDALVAFDSRTGERRWRYHAPSQLSFLRSSPFSVVQAQGGALVAALDSGRLLKLENPNAAPHLRSDRHAPLHLDRLPGGNEAVGVGGFSLTIWDLDRLVRIERYASREKLLGLSASRQLGLVATRTLHHLLIWDVDSGQILNRIPVGIGLPALHFCPTRNEVAVVSEHGVTMHAPNQAPRFAEVPDARVLSVRYSPNGVLLMAGCSDGAVRTFAVA